MKVNLLRRFLFVFFFLSSSGVMGEWEPFHFEGGITLYKKEGRDDGLIPFRAVGEFEGELRSYLIALLDHSQKPLWAPKLKKVTVHLVLSPKEVIFSEYYRTPWPASDRQFLLKGTITVPEKGKVLFQAKNYGEKSFRDENHIVCDVRLLDLLLENVGPKKTRITFSFSGDMRGWMPDWLINIIQKKWPLRFLQGLQKQVQQTPKEDSEEYRKLIKLQEFRDSL